MTMYESSDLHKRVERYEAALEEIRAAQQDIKNVLHDQVLYERWQQLGADLGFVVVPSSAPHPPAAVAPQPDMHMNMNMNSQPSAEMADSWS